ncbi:PTS sugar transporter subunit IIA [Paenibacillus sp. MER 99-2]|uniref:PTS sugar transporter subunit IIA n=1 Tax=Paenibacillus sp. MER 99-2 TaxID=2939572 RepID=UPI00203CB3C7|nr:PTS sugar transporter subunit IIA [Paenibacillus sp. MER 99-2]MCM3173053.1 PTS sugar transporter subunit IIA [Paenibacillus sp. MER 99-2]
MITTDQIYLDQSLPNKEDVFQFISAEAERYHITSNRKQLEADLWEREQVYSTGLQDHFAIPHTQSEAVIRPAVMVIRLSEPIDWDSHDGKPVKYIFVILVPKGHVDVSHLRIISSLATLLLEDSFKEGIAAAAKPEDVYGLLHQYTEGLVS